MFGGKNFPAKHVSQFNLKQAAHIHTYKIRPLSVSKKNYKRLISLYGSSRNLIRICCKHIYYMSSCFTAEVVLCCLASKLNNLRSGKKFTKCNPSYHLGKLSVNVIVSRAIVSS